MRISGKILKTKNAIQVKCPSEVQRAQIEQLKKQSNEDTIRIKRCREEEEEPEAGEVKIRKKKQMEEEAFAEEKR